MGNFKFTLSDMISNTWFYKRNNIGRRRNQSKAKNKHQPILPSNATASTAQQSKAGEPHLSHQRKSYYFTRELNTAASSHETFCSNLPTNPKSQGTQVPPGKSRKASKKRRSTRRNNRPSTYASITPRIVTTSVSGSPGFSCQSSHDSVCASSDLTPEEYPNSPVDSSSEHESLLPEFGSNLSLTTERFDMMFSCAVPCNKPFNNAKFDDLDGFDALPKLELPPIKTKSANFPDNAKGNMKMKKKQKNESNKSTKQRKSSTKVEEKTAYRSLAKDDKTYKGHRTPPARSFSASSPGIKLHNPKKTGSRMIQGLGRKSVSSSSNSRKSLLESSVVVKSSQDPQRDFKESMVEMIVENNIRATKDLEDLLACYLCLNSDEYHGLIIKVFKQIWLDIIDDRLF